MFPMGSSPWVGIVLLSLAFVALCVATEVTYDAHSLIINGEKRIIFSGSVHYPRSTVEMWPNIIQKAKDGGLDAIESYVFWDRHEHIRREYDFSGNLNFVKFFKLVQEVGLYAILRIGPYVCAEWNYGGFPIWLHNMPGIELRTDNPIYKNEMQIFTTKIVSMAKEANLFASQGGPIILAQIENEYGNIMVDYGDAGKSYIKWCAQMALAQNIGVPWIMCQQHDAPQPMINTCNGYYCDQFQPNNPKSPKMFTENWIGWFPKMGPKGPPHKNELWSHKGGPYITTSYDYDAPLDEYGNLNQPKWGHLKQLHAAIKLGEKILTNGTRTDKDLGNQVTLTTYTNANGERFCFLSNINNNQDANVALQQDGKYIVPSWSVTILNGCNKEVFNTAKVNSQTSIMVKKSDDGSPKLTWVWIPEKKKDTMQGKGSFKANQLLEQKELTFDVSDYLWYMTSVDINDTSIWSNATLHVNTMGHTIRAYVNGRHVGYKFSQWGGNFTYEKQVSLKEGPNIITLLSATVGLANYGANFDKIKTGIAGGPVQLIGKNNVTIDLSTNLWSYKVGLNGEKRQLYNSQPRIGVSWRTNSSYPIGRPMTWYKAEFKAPSGADPVVVDLQGMGKGQAWVNGLSIGRYWTSWISDTNGCSDTCDYRGKYTTDKCNTNCCIPSQRWYHVPRSFLNNDKNTLVLFEEIGGNPKNISFQTVTAETICAQVEEGALLELSCQGGKTITQIQFASFGNPEGKCGSFKKGTWEATDGQSTVEAACIGKSSCGFTVTKEAFGVTFSLMKVDDGVARLVVQATC
ncbi:hypothetical protein Fmac_025261 [Flemingia macrophylla]|uniref:Beta-galactosidase n=1 Tax=Flemingia macrophylla TaxID=520843 RepID=A0ABD1LRQ0_9FABA